MKPPTHHYLNAKYHFLSLFHGTPHKAPKPEQGRFTLLVMILQNFTLTPLSISLPILSHHHFESEIHSHYCQLCKLSCRWHILLQGLRVMLLRPIRLATASCLLASKLNRVISCADCSTNSWGVLQDIGWHIWEQKCQPRGIARWSQADTQNWNATQLTYCMNIEKELQAQ